MSVELVSLQLRIPRYSAIWVATALLFAVSPLLASGSVSGSALLSTLPFAAILATAAIGQTLVVQQRGLDLSVAGMITLTTIIVTRFPNGSDSRLWGALGLVVLACVASGLVSGIAITWLGVTPLVATLGVNALLTGVVLQITNGASTSSAAPGLADFAIARLRWSQPGGGTRRRHPRQESRALDLRAREPCVRRRGDPRRGLSAHPRHRRRQRLSPAHDRGGRARRHVARGRAGKRPRDRGRRALPHATRCGGARHGSALVRPDDHPGLDHRARDGCPKRALATRGAASAVALASPRRRR